MSFQAKEVEETIEGLLLRLEEFCSLTDMVSVCPGGVDLGPGQLQVLPGVFWGSHFGGDLAAGRKGGSSRR